MKATLTKDGAPILNDAGVSLTAYKNHRTGEVAYSGYFTTDHADAIPNERDDPFVLKRSDGKKTEIMIGDIRGRVVEFVAFGPFQ